MISWGAKYLLSASLLGWILAISYGIATGGDIVGAMSMGYKGGVGDHFGYTLAMTFAFLFLMIALVNLFSREGIAVDKKGEHLPVLILPKLAPTYWAPVTGFAVTCMIIGLSYSSAFLILGIVLLFVVLIQWSLQAWADGLSHDAITNEIARSRVSSNVDTPIFSILIGAFVVLGISRVLLAVPAIYSTVVASVVATLVFVISVALAKFEPSKKMITGIVAFGAVAVLVGGIVAAGIGERDFSHHGESHEVGAEGVQE